MSNNENSQKENQTEKSKMTWIKKEGEIEEVQIPTAPQLKSVTILRTLLDEMTEHSKDAMPREAIGLLGGKELRANELMVSKILFVTEGDETSVSFSDEDFNAFEEILENNNFCVGWWHSHPGYGLFLSQTDINTHIFSFQLHNALSVALVIEPTKIDMNGRALFQFYQVVREKGKKSRYQEIASYIR